MLKFIKLFVVFSIITVFAALASAVTYTVTVTAGPNGKFSTSDGVPRTSWTGSYEAGTTETFTAIPDGGYEVDGWSDQGFKDGSIEKGSFPLSKINSAHSLHVTFKPKINTASTSRGSSRSRAGFSKGNKNNGDTAADATAAGTTAPTTLGVKYPQPLIVTYLGFLPVPIPATDSGVTTSLNGTDTAVGYLTTEEGEVEAWSWNHFSNAFSILPAPKLPTGQVLGSYRAIAIDDAGNIVVNTTSTLGEVGAYLFNPTSLVYSPIANVSPSLGATASAITPNGLFVVGQVKVVAGYEAFLWSKATGVTTYLGDLGGTGIHSQANDVTTDGAEVVGYGTNTLGRQAFVWTKATGMVAIPDFVTSTNNSVAESVTADGAFVVGTSITYNGEIAFIWSRGQGTYDLQNWLTENGTPLPGYIVLAAPFISATGEVIALNCATAAGVPEAITIESGFGFALYAQDESFSANLNTELSVPAAKGVLFSDVNTDGAKAALVTAPLHAKSFVLNSDGSFNYTPAVGFSGDDSFQYNFSNYGLKSNFATVSISVYPNIASLTLSSPVIYGNANSKLTLTYTGPVPKAGVMEINLSQSVPADTGLLSEVFATAGATSDFDYITPKQVSAASADKITATFNGISTFVTLTLEPLVFTSVKATNASVVGGIPNQGSVNFNGPLFANETLALSSSNINVATVPTSIIVDEYLSNNYFQIVTKPVTASAVITIQAKLGTQTLSCTFTVVPAITTFSLETASVTGGISTTGTVTFPSVDTYGGTMKVVSSSPDVTVPATVTVAANATTFSFPITTKTVTVKTTATITVTYGPGGGISKSEVLTLNP